MFSFQCVSQVRQGVRECLRDIKELPSSILSRDPAARNRLEVLFLYPGVRAVLAHRITHAMWASDFKFCAKALSECARILSGIEIHPGAQLGERLFIDHGFGVVIGETAVVGSDVTIFQCVTLGGVSGVSGKRHPTIDSFVTIGVGASVLGDIHVGKSAKIGAGAVVLQNVEQGATVVGVPARPLSKINRPKTPNLTKISKAFT